MKPDDYRLTDLLLFDKRVRLKSHFQHNPSESDPDSQFKSSKGWTPPKGASQAMETFLTTTTTHFMTMTKKKKYPNITPQEKIAIKELSDNTDIVIKPPDKGSAIVIQDRDKYIVEAQCQLSNKDHYRRTGTKTATQVCNKVNDYIRECKKTGTIPPII